MTTLTPTWVLVRSTPWFSQNCWGESHAWDSSFGSGGSRPFTAGDCGTYFSRGPGPGWSTYGPDQIPDPT